MPYDVAAYIWPAFTGREIRTRQFWPEGMGEWQTVKNSTPKEGGYCWDRKPLWGYRDEADPATMEFQIEQALSYGVNVFIYDWYWFDRRPFLEQCLNEGFLGAGNNEKMRFYLMWANHDANYCWDKRLSDLTWREDCTVWQGAVDRKEFERLTERIIQRYFPRPNYYTVEGRPVFMIYDIENLLNGLGGFEAAGEALSDFRKRTVAAGFPGLELQLVLWGERFVNASGVDKRHTVSDRVAAKELGFDSVTNYQFVHFTSMNRSYPEILRDVKAEWERIDALCPLPFYPHISLGWDNNPRFSGFVDNVCRDNTPENVEKALRMAKEYLDSHDRPAPLVTVNSWNEWTETSYLQPDNRYGYGYLEAVKKVFLS